MRLSFSFVRRCPSSFSVALSGVSVFLGGRDLFLNRVRTPCDCTPSCNSAKGVSREGGHFLSLFRSVVRVFALVFKSVIDRSFFLA